MRGEALDAVGAVIDPAKTRDGIFEKPFPFVTSAAGSDLDDAAGKIAELRTSWLKISRDEFRQRARISFAGGLRDSNRWP